MDPEDAGLVAEEYANVTVQAFLASKTAELAREFLEITENDVQAYLKEAEAVKKLFRAQIAALDDPR